VGPRDPRGVFSEVSVFAFRTATRRGHTSDNDAHQAPDSVCKGGKLGRQRRSTALAQFADKLQFIGNAFLHSPVIDATGLDGSYDFSLSFSPLPPALLAQLSARGADGGAADPIGGVTIFDAVDRQLGLKLVEQKRPAPVLVIDHIEQKPTDN
jgi:uncharacterized protein (TIGR03435 family)